MSKEDWLEKSRAAIEKIYSEEPNDDNVIVLGALLAIVGHEYPNEINVPIIQEKPIQAIATLPMEKSLQELVDDELTDAEMYYNMGEYEIARDELRHADRFLSVLKARATQTDKNFLHNITERRDAIAAKL